MGWTVGDRFQEHFPQPARNCVLSEVPALSLIKQAFGCCQEILNRNLPLSEAQRIDQSSLYTEIRVVEEIFVESTQETMTRKIFRGGKVEH